MPAGSPDRVRFEELTRDELRELGPRATVVVPLGATEQHGPHLPVCTDTLIVSALAERAAREAAAHIPIVVAPALPVGFSHHHRAFGGTISVGLRPYEDLLTDLAESLASSGFRRVFFLNGHGGNDAPMRAVGDRLLYERGIAVHVGAASYWACAADALEALDLEVGPIPGHAGGFETSCVLALRPGLVRRDRFPPREDGALALVRSQIKGVVVRRPGLWEASDGRSDDARGADDEIGERALSVLAGRIAEVFVSFHRSTPETG
jgi:creatinine amidohydrolase